MTYVNEHGATVEISKDDERWLDDNYFRMQQDLLAMDAPKVALAYRVSTKGQVDKDDIPMQKIECRKFAQNHGWRVVMERAEKGVSGSKVSAKKRDVIQELRSAALEQRFDILLVYMFDRLGRIDSETPFVLEWFVSHGIEMWSSHEGQQKIESHCDKLVNYIRFWQAAGESEKTSIRTRDRIRQIASSGHYTGGTVPYGYRAVFKGRMNKRNQPVKDLEIDPEEGPIVQEIFLKIANEGYSLHRIAKMLNDRGLTSHGGAKFQANHIRRIVLHEGYTGYIVAKGARSEFIPELKLVEEQTYQDAVRIMKDRSKENQEKRNLPLKCESNMLLTGNVYCGCCGLRLSGFNQRDSYMRKSGERVYFTTPKYFCYAKSQNIRPCTGQQLYKAEIVDDIVDKLAREMFATFRGVPKGIMVTKEMEKQTKRLAQQERDQLAEVQKEEKMLSRWYDELERCIEGTSNFEEEDVALRLKTCKERIRTAKAKLAECREEKENAKARAKEVNDYYNQFQGWVEEYEQASIERKRVILSNLFSRIEVSRGYEVKVTVNMSYRQFMDLAKNEMTEENKTANAG